MKKPPDLERLRHKNYSDMTPKESAFLQQHYQAEIDKREAADAAAVADAVAAGTVVHDCDHQDCGGEPGQCPLSWELGGDKICDCCEGCRASCARDI